MGWSFAMDRGYGRKELIAELRRPGRWFGNTRMLKAQAVGNHHWYVCETTAEDGTVERWIGLDLMRGGGREMGWGSKNLTEQCGPCEVDCPVTYLELASPTDHHYAAPWREEVRAYHAAKVARPKLDPGVHVWFQGSEYILIEPYAPRRGWLVKEVQYGDKYRLKARQLARASMTAPVSTGHDVPSQGETK